MTDQVGLPSSTGTFPGYGNRQKHLTPNKIQQFLLNRFHQKIIALVRQTGAKMVLDAGCGEGFVMHYLQQQGIATNAVGGDFSAESLAWGRQNVHTAIPLINLNLYQLPLPDNSFPLVICLEVLEHLEISGRGLNELARVSNEYVLMSVPHEPFFRGANFIRGKNIRHFGNDPEHMQNFSGGSFKKLVSSQLDLLWHGYSFPWQIALGRKRK